MDGQRAVEEKDLRRLFERFVRSGLSGEIEEFISCVDEPYAGVGMGEQGLVHSKEDIDNLMRACYRPARDVKIEFDIQDFTITWLNEDAAAVCGIVIVSSTPECGETIHSGIFQTIVARRTGKDWGIGFTHASPMLLTEESIAAYPIRFVDETLSKLKAELQTDTFDLINKSFSGGIFGTYARDEFPLYFANDRFILMMGYERKEFEEKFREGTTAFNYVGDAADMEEKSREAYFSGDDYEMTTRFVKNDGTVLWVELQCRKSTDNEGNEIFIVIVTDITEMVVLQKETQYQHKMILDSITYAGKIQKNLLPEEEVFKEAFSDYSVIWKPRDIVGGDIYWLKNFVKGTVLCVCDCTGHGTPGALLTMLVISVIESAVSEYNCDDTAGLLKELDKRLASTLNLRNDAKKNGWLDINDGCDIAVLFISRNGAVRISSANIRVFICNGREVRQIKGQRLNIGDGITASGTEVKSYTVAPDRDNRFYIASDGLYDQIGKDGRKFGFRQMEEIILRSHGRTLTAVSEEIWQASEDARGDEGRRDDVELIMFRP